MQNLLVFSVLHAVTCVLPFAHRKFPENVTDNIFFPYSEPTSWNLENYLLKLGFYINQAVARIQQSHTLHTIVCFLYYDAKLYLYYDAKTRTSIKTLIFILRPRRIVYRRYEIATVFSFILLYFWILCMIFIFRKNLTLRTFCFSYKLMNCLLTLSHNLQEI